VARHASRGGELAEELPDPLHVLADAGVDLGVGALHIDVGNKSRAAVAGAGQVDDVGVALLDEPVEVDVDEVEAGRCAPVPKQARLNMLGAQRVAQERVVLQVDLPDREVIARLPVAVHPVEQLGR
jgi:hypothetical protein